MHAQRNNTLQINQCSAAVIGMEKCTFIVKRTVVHIHAHIHWQGQLCNVISADLSDLCIITPIPLPTSVYQCQVVTGWYAVTHVYNNRTQAVIQLHTQTRDATCTGAVMENSVLSGILQIT